MILSVCFIYNSKTSNDWTASSSMKAFIGFPVAQMVEHGASNTKIMGSIPRESKSWSNVKL